MEEMIVLVIQFVVEIFFQIILWIPFEFLVSRRWLFVGGGLLCGGVSLFLRPQHVIAIEWIRTLNLIVTPVILAYFAQWADSQMSRFKKGEGTQHAFLDNWLFFFLFALTRFILAK